MGCLLSHLMSSRTNDGRKCLEELNNISVPRFEVDSEGSLTFATALIDVASSVIENTEHGYKSIGVSVSSSNVGALSADAMHG